MSPTPTTMKALRLVKYNTSYKLSQIPTPTPNDNDILVKVGAAGFCHTDYQVYEGVYGSPTPLTPSHEPVGTIAAVGKNVSGDWHVGQRIGLLNFRHACNACIGCQGAQDPVGPDEPDTRFCENKEMAGISADGGFAEYVIADPATSVPLPEGIEFEQAAPLMCAGATVWTGLNYAAVPPGLPIGVIGIGGLGMYALQFAAGLGHPTIAIDNRQEGRDLARSLPPQFQPTAIVDSSAPDAQNQIIQAAGGGGLAGVLVCTDNVPATEWSLKLLRTHGTCIPLGLPPDGFKFSAFDVVFKELTIRGSLVANCRLVTDMMRFVAEKGVRAHVSTVRLEDAEDLPQMYSDPHLKGRLVVVM